MSDTFYHNLPNGVQIVHRKTTSPVVYVGIMVGAGTRHELPNENGMAHYIEHCVFKGTEHYTARQIINHIEGIGGEINAYTTKEETTFYAATLSNHFRTTLHLLAEMVLHPTFSKKETDKEVTVILDEIESYNDSPSELIYDDFENMIFEGSSLAMPILGTKKTLRRISKSPDIALGWMQQHYRPERMVLFVLGNVSTKQVIASAEKELGELYSSASSTSRTSSTSSTSSTSQTSSPSSFSRTYKRHTHQTHIMLGSHAYPIGHPKQLTMYLLNNILGGGNVRCGEGEEETEEVIEYIRLPESLVGTGEFFVLIAKGDSMIDAGVNEGDYVVIRKQNTASDGDYVVALYEGLNNLKELVVDNGKYILRSCNEDKESYPDIYPRDLKSSSSSRQSSTGRPRRS